MVQKLGILPVLYLTLTFWCGGIVSAQPLTLGEALTLALKQNPEVQATQRRLGLAQAERVIADVAPNPTLSSEGEFLADARKFNLGLGQELELGGKRSARIAVAEGLQTVTEAQIRLALWQIRANVRESYTQLSLAVAKEEALQQIVDLNRTLLDVAQRRFKAGAIPQLDVLRVENILAQSENELDISRIQVQEAQDFLNQGLGQELGVPISVVPVDELGQFSLRISTEGLTSAALLPTTSLSEPAIRNQLLAQALQNRPDFQVLIQQQELAQRQQELAEANRSPNLTVSVGLQVEQALQEGQVSQTLVGPRVGVSIPLTIFNQSQGEVLKAEAERQQLAAQAVALRQRVYLDISSAYRQFLLARTQQERYAKIFLVKTREIQQLSQFGYERGKFDLTVPLLAQAEANRVRQEFFQRVVQYQQAISALEQALGLPIDS